MTASTRRRVIATTVVAIFAVLTAGCSGDPSSSIAPLAETTPGGTGSADPTLEPSETTPPAPEDVAERDAEDTVEQYLVLFTELQTDHDRSLEELEDLALSQALDLATDLLTWDRTDGYVAVGTRTLTDITITDVQLDPTDTPDGYPTVELTGCLDVSNLDLVDADGVSAVLPTREDRVLYDYVITNTGTADSPQWLVSGENPQFISTDPPEVATCP